ncbi:uncharacterized protein LOC143445738 [Clavelina lepadiformis]|uniref:uncharacterized protein LOC143445738 n=1 Tax=Clavelina lepadiformis TaxID=159417 RepID=UPI00404239FC
MIFEVTLSHAVDDPSLLRMRKEVKMTLVQLDVQFGLCDEELKRINEMCEALAPFKAAVDVLASENADLLLSEKIIAFILKKVKDLRSEISKDLNEMLGFVSMSVTMMI